MRRFTHSFFSNNLRFVFFWSCWFKECANAIKHLLNIIKEFQWLSFDFIFIWNVNKKKYFYSRFKEKSFFSFTHERKPKVFKRHWAIGSRCPFTVRWISVLNWSSRSLTWNLCFSLFVLTSLQMVNDEV